MKISRVPLLELDAVGIEVESRAQKRVLITELNLKVFHSDRIAVVGPNGSGKSTLLRVIRGDTPCSSGHLKRRVSQDLTASLIQHYRNSLFPWLAVEQHTQIFAQSPRFDHDFHNRCVSDLGLGSLSGSRVFQLSGWEQQLLALYLTLSLRSELFLLDEPLSAVDIRRRQLAAKLITDRIEESGAAMICVTHSMQSAVELTNQAVVLVDPETSPEVVGSRCGQSYLNSLRELFLVNSH